MYTSHARTRNASADPDPTHNAQESANIQLFTLNRSASMG